MDSYFSIFQGILSTEGNYLNIYLNGLEDHKKFGVQSSEGFDLVQHISSLLTKSTSRLLGLRLLAKFIENCPNDVLEKKGNLWTTLVLKACNSQELENDTFLSFDVLGKLIKRSQNVPDFSKSFTSTHIFKVYECLTNVPLSKTNYALSCIETCLRIYPGSSGSSRGIIERFLWKNVDHLDAQVVQNCGKCLHLLQQVKGGGIQGINNKTQWKNYQLQLIGGIHSIYNEMFANCVEMYEEKIEQEKLPWHKTQAVLDHEPVMKAAQMYNRCRNMITYLNIALREPFPTEKPILIKKILNVIIRGLSVNTFMLEQNPIADNIALSILLPKLHVILLELLNTAVVILRGYIRPYSELIFGLIIDVLKWTSLKNDHKDEKLFLVLRKKVYETVSLWCNVLCSGNRCETIAEYLFQEIKKDITPAQIECTLKVLSGARKHMSKKARRQLHNAQNEKSNLSQNHSNDINRKENHSEEKNWELCISALRCLHVILLTVGNFVKPTTLKMVHTTIVQICAILYELPLKPIALYSNKNCRIEMYNVLNAILMAPHHLCPPPTEMILTIIQHAYTRDESVKVRLHCGFILKSLEKIIHPQKESLLFTIEARDISNTFIKLGQERLLPEFGHGFLNAQNDNNLIDFVEMDNNTTNSEFINKPLTTDQNDDNDEIHTICDNVFSENMKEIENNANARDTTLRVSETKDDSDDNQKEPIKDINIENGGLLKRKNKNDIIPSSPEFMLRVDDDGEVDTIDENHSNDGGLVIANNSNIGIMDEKNEITDLNEPTIKKQKIDIEHKEENKMKTNETENLVQINDIDEDNLLADIASQFVDELD